MKGRCYNTKNVSYHNYGGRGITVCDRWLKDFWLFVEDMGYRPENHTLDRIDNNGNYSPENCRWSDIKKQSNNKRNTRIVEYKGQKKSLSEWASFLGIPYERLAKRYSYGFTGSKLMSKTKINNKTGVPNEK